MESTLDSKLNTKELRNILTEPYAFDHSLDMIHFMTGPMSRPMQDIYGFDSDVGKKKSSISPIGASAALLDPEWREKVKELYVGYLEAIVDPEKGIPQEILGKIIIPTNTYKLSLDGVVQAIINPQAYNKYTDLRSRKHRKEPHERNYGTIRRRLDVANDAYKKTVAVIDEGDQSMDKKHQFKEIALLMLAKEILRKIAHESVEVINEALDEVGIDRKNVLITTDIGPEFNPYLDDAPERPNIASTRYHLPTVLALGNAGVDYIHFGTVAAASEVYGMAEAAKIANMPFAISFYTDNSCMHPQQSRRTLLGKVISDLVDTYPDNFIYAGVNCRGTLQNFYAADGIKNEIGRNEPLVRKDALNYLLSAYSNCSTQIANGLDGIKEPIQISPEKFAEGNHRLYKSTDSNFTILGGCCGTDPAYYKEFMPLLHEKLQRNIAHNIVSKDMQTPRIQ